MPLPPQPITVTGGCHCGATRYRVQIPSLQERPLHPTYDRTSEKTPVHLPFVCIDHCNDCRRATGALLGVVLCTPTSYVSFSLLPTPPAPNQATSDRHYIPAEDIFPPSTPDLSNTCLSLYESSEGRTRIFCKHCGTHFAYSAWPYPPGWPRMLDLWIGSVDREVLEKEWLVPERHLWWDVGVEWIRKFGSEGSGGVPKHGSYRVDGEVLDG